MDTAFPSAVAVVRSRERQVGMFIRIKILLALLALMAVAWAHPHHDAPSEWIPEAELKQLFGEGGDFTVLRVTNPDEFAADVQKQLGRKLVGSDLDTPMFRARKRDGKLLGFAWVGVVSLDKKTSMLLVGTDSQNKIVRVLIPDSTSALAKNPFLAQFNGKSANDSFAMTKGGKAQAAESAQVGALVQQAVVMLAQATKE